MGTLVLLGVGRAGPAAIHSAADRVVRIGFDGAAGSALNATAIRSLQAGAYQDWTARMTPPTPAGMQYIQTVRLHQELTCPINSENAWNRDVCPYAEPHDYIVRPSLEQIGAIAAANPGSVWLVGNEPDRRDWPGSGQDEMLPELYAAAYHEVYTAIKEADPTARVAIGGIIQATPVRLQYLTRIWDAYQAKYGTEMPVDVWNVHNFILREVFQDYGADIPPGIPDDTTEGMDYASDWTHIDMDIFDRQIRAFRAWMAERGQQEKSLIVSEYGVLYKHCAEWRWTGTEWVCDRDFDNLQVVRDFMIATFDYFLNARDCTIGYVADGCRLVQQWFWFSLDHDPSGFNPHGRLYDRGTDSLTPLGEAYRDWVAANMSALAQPIPTDDRGRPRQLYLPQVAKGMAR